jgi:hypothetical protein
VTQVEIVALWAGLITGIASIVLSFVAIAASVLTDRRSSKISEHTIQSLQKIETTVAQQSDDTRQLIKAAWDKLLGTVDRQFIDSGLASAKTIAQGIAAELREELQPSGCGGSSATPERGADTDRIDKLIERLESSLEAILRRAPSSARPGQSLDLLLENVSRLSPEAQALLKNIRGHHLSRQQYQKLSESKSLGSAILELRREGLLIPVQHSYKGRSVPCYYFPPGVGRQLHAAGPLLPVVPDEVEKMVTDELRATGYPAHDEEPGDVGH